VVSAAAVAKKRWKKKRWVKKMAKAIGRGVAQG
jgi:hypothetical protein